ncbi:response regulator [Sphaerotilus sp.]|uniref:response regulator n=1 Tax=Sphaerotilus sp. TaxID=2093942 RepID=UPI00286E8B6A|nr:response regulator [Sphaerotilus sp.]
MANILVVDDEMGIRALLQEILTDEGHSVELAENAAQARTLRERQRPDLVLLDIWMPDVDGITLLKEWGTGAQLNMPVIMMSGHGTIDTAVEATKYGAMAFLEKPITLQKLLRAVEQGLSKPAPRSVAPANPTGTNEMANAGLARIERMDYLPAVEATHYATPMHSNYGNGLAVAPSITMASGPQAEQIFLLDRPLREARDAFEKAYFEFHLARENGSMTRVAERTGLERTHLYRKLKQLGVDLTRNKRGAS